ncbi:MAG: hypothetical protein JWP66_565 [Naasia sp.]|nr:hypothetical protein [Naasia sp.]
MVVVAIAVLAVAGLALAFFLGSRLGGAAAPAPTPTGSTPKPAPTPTPSPPMPAAPIAPAPPGVTRFEALFGVECLDPFPSPWAREFTVVDCRAPHAAQLVARGVYAGDASAPYPGEQALTQDLGILCTAPGVLDLEAARAYPDLQYSAAYPPSEEAWAAGDRRYWCFVSRSSGEPLTGSVATPR